MRKFIILLKGIVVLSLVTLSFIANADEETCNEDDEYYDSKIKVALRFMPGDKKCIKYEPPLTPYDSTYYYYRDLKEFIINKNNKYCLWGSKNWDEECQNVSMEYAYSNYGYAAIDWQEFKQVVTNFIKHIQSNQIDEALKLGTENVMLFTDDDANCLAKNHKDFPGCRSYFNKFHKDKECYDDFNIESFRENLMQIDADNFKFYLTDLMKRMMYNIIIPYEHKNVKKEFSIVFSFSHDRWGEMNYEKLIYALGIYNHKLD